MHCLEVGSMFLGWMHSLILQLFFPREGEVESWLEKFPNKTFYTARPRTMHSLGKILRLLSY